MSIQNKNDNFQEHSEYASRMIEAVPVLCAYIDGQQKHCFANNNYQKWFASNKDTVVNKTMLQILGKDNYVIFQPYIERALAGESVEFEATMLYDKASKDIYAKDIYVIYTPEFAEDGTVKGFFTLIKDVTAVKDKESQLHLAMEHSAIGMAIVSQTGKWMKVNKALCDMIGYTEEELLTIDFQTITHPDDLSVDLSYVQQMLNKEIKTYQMEKRYYHKNGEIVWILLYVSLIWNSDGTPKYFFSQIQNITKRKMVEEELDETYKFQELIKESNPDLIFVKDHESKIVDANKAFLEVYPEEMRDKVIGYTTVENYDKKEAEAFLAMDRKAFVEGYSDVEETINFPDGRTRTLHTQKIRFTDHKGEQFILGLGRDITNLKQTQEKLKKSIDELTQSNTALEHFAHLVSHDLKEPLRTVSSCTQLLVQKYNDKLDFQGKDLTYSIIDGANRMRMLVDDLLTYSKLGVKALPFETIECNEILGYVLENLSQAIEETQATITSDYLPQVTGDKTQLIQLFQNLLNNAIKYHKYEAVKIHIAVNNQEDQWLISVQDNGKGIKEKYLDKIFTIFKRLENRLEYPGTGIGLAICHQVVENHGGKIWAESEYGKGSTFYFTIPKVFNDSALTAERKLVTSNQQ